MRFIERVPESLFEYSYFRKRMARGEVAAFDVWLDASPDTPADVGDELPIF
ncbi:MAG: hypothetical protein LBU53_13895 [Zoogloeaceae bacterium]|jgi:hypothetical protein|nr:hypothetical protein [Zoogloeaceae bacterium]